MAAFDLGRADELLRKGRHGEVIELLRNRLSDDAEDADVRVRLAEAYRLSGNAERAFHHFYRAALLYGRKGDTPASYRALKAASLLSPNEPDVLFRMAESLEILGQEAELEATLRRLVSAAKASGDRRRLWALERLHAQHPEELEVAIHRAVALGEARRIDEAVAAWKRVAARSDLRGHDLAPMLQQAAASAPERPEVGVELARILLAQRRPREALALLVPYYEKAPEDVAILEALVDTLEQLNATDKVIPARVELLKARVKLGQRVAAMGEITKLLQLAPSDPAVVEVAAHACAAFGLNGEATRLWLQLARFFDARSLRPERDRAVHRILELNGSHEDGLGLAVRALRDAGRLEDAAVFERRLREVRRARTEAPEELPSISAPSRGPAPLARDESVHTAPADAEPTRTATVAPARARSFTGTMVVNEADVLDVAEEVSLSDVLEARTPGFIVPSELSDPEAEAMPIHRVWPGDEAGAAEATRLVPRSSPVNAGPQSHRAARPLEPADEAATRVAVPTSSRAREPLGDELHEDDHPTSVELPTRPGARRRSADSLLDTDAEVPAETPSRRPHRGEE